MTTPTPPADPDPTIRPAQPGDAAGMHRVARLAYRQYVPRIGREPAPMTCDYAAIIAAGYAWVADQNGQITGILVLVPHQDHLLLENIAVIPGRQGSGLGTLLLQVAETQARQAALPEVRLYTNEAMTENITYYPRHGYRESHRTLDDGFRRVFFTKTIPAD